VLQLGATSLVVDGVTVFRDHADENLFWYLPAPVRLAKRAASGEPEFTLITYRDAAVDEASRGGGFLMFEVDLRLEPDALESIKGQLERLAPGRPVLAPVPFDQGTVECIALNVQGAAGTVATPGAFVAVEEILGASVPSLFGDNQAAFSLKLSTTGATILKQAFQQGAAPIGVIYKLTFTGLRPALHVSIEADLALCYDALSVGLEAQVYWVRAGLEAAFERLKQTGAIKITVADFVPDGQVPQQETWALDFFRDKLLSEWFEPSLNPTAVPTTAAPATTTPVTTTPPRPPLVQPPTTTPPRPPGSSVPVGGAPVGGPAGTPVGGPAGTPVGGPVGGAPVGGPAGTPVGGPPGTPIGGPSGTPIGGPPAAGTPGTGTPGTGTPPTGTPARPATGGATPATPAGTPPATPAAGADKALVTFKLRYVRKEERKRFSLVLDRAEAVQRVYAPQGFFSELAGRLEGPTHFVDVDLDDPFFRALTVDVQCGVDFAALGLVSINVALSYGRDDDPGGPKTADLIFDRDHTGTQRFSVFMNAALDLEYRYRIEYNFAATGPWRAKDISYTFSGETDDRTLELDPSRHLGFLEVTVEPTDIDPEALSFTDVQLHYQDGGGWEQRSSLLVKADSPVQTWRVRTADRAQQAYSYRFAHTLSDGSVVTTDPVTTTSSHVAVVDPFVGRLDISIAPAWDPQKVRTVLVDLAYDDPGNAYHRELRLEFAGADLAVRNLHIAMHDPELRTFQHRSTIVGVDGQVRQTGFLSTTDTLVTIG
jgi:hypothetical protein